jgi:predicted nucleotidyltransferase component of viral defense system
MAKRVQDAAEAWRRMQQELLGRRPGPDKQKLITLEFLVARLMLEFGRDVTLKGGFAAHLRLPLARTTKDADLDLYGVADRDTLLARLRSAADRDLGDFFTFEVEFEEDGDEILAEEAEYGGYRFAVRAELGGREFGRVTLDVALAEDMILPAEVQASTTGYFEAFGLETPSFRLYPLETQIAEKLYIFAKKRTLKNTRAKDLPDLALLATLRPLDAVRLRDVIQRKFAQRVAAVRERDPGFEYEVPGAVPLYPRDANWEASYTKMKRNQPGLPWETLEECHAAVCAFLDPVLAGGEGVWEPGAWRWVQP